MDWKWTLCVALYVLAGVMILAPDKMCKSKKMRIARSLVTALAGVTAIVVFLFEPTFIWKWGVICCAGVLVAVSCREVYRILKK